MTCTANSWRCSINYKDNKVFILILYISENWKKWISKFLLQPLYACPHSTTLTNTSEDRREKGRASYLPAYDFCFKDQDRIKANRLFTWCFYDREVLLKILACNTKSCFPMFRVSVVRSVYKMWRKYYTLRKRNVNT